MFVRTLSMREKPDASRPDPARPGPVSQDEGMLKRFKASGARLIERFRPYLEALSALDDPQGDYLFRLEERVRRLEAEVRALRPGAGRPKADTEGG